jgi:flagellar motor protein MotB
VPAPAPAAAAKTEDGNGGWLRDVLRNANSPAANAAPQQNLTALTDEIARSIEPSALADAWQRYQAGEQNVFSRRIYTLTGQSTYDQVRKRLTSDSEFARNSSAYMAEFEQLLKRAAGGADPLGETRQYLLSDRGKVYTMLAHAAGRLG